MWDLASIKKMNTDAEIRKRVERARALNRVRKKVKSQKSKGE